MFNNEIITKMQSYIGKDIFIYFPPVQPEPYFGNLDVSPSHLIQETLKEFCVFKNTIILKTESNKEYDIKEIKIFMHINDLINWRQGILKVLMLLRIIIDKIVMCNINRMCVSMEGECDWIKYKELKN